MLRTTIAVLSFALIASFAVAQAKPAEKPKTDAQEGMTVTVPSYVNAECPMMHKPTRPAFSVHTDKGTIGLCCKKCQGNAGKDTDALYAKAYPETKALETKTCPISGHAIEKDGVKVQYQGFEFKVCCKDCVKPALANGDIIVTRLSNAKVVDVGNKTCPVSGKPVADNTFCLIGDNLVHLGSKDAVEDVKKDAAKTLEKAKASAPKAKDGAAEKHD